MKTILVATDYSDAANNAVEYAASLAKETGAELLLFNVFKISIHASNSMASTSTIDHQFQKSEDRLEEAAAEIAERHGIKVDYRLAKDDTVESLRRYTASHAVDLVVMGIQSNLIEYRIFGNTTTEVIQLMQFPLLVVPNEIAYNGIEKMMYACETSYLKEGCELGFLKQMVRELNAKLEVFHVLTNGSDTEDTKEFEQSVGAILHDIDHTYRYVSNSKVDVGISVGLEQQAPDLLVMVPHKIGFFESLFKGSNTGQMTVKTRVPLLVIPNEKAC
jgi:nucleotide-binding universal stress UspA family protein